MKTKQTWAFVLGRLSIYFVPILFTVRDQPFTWASATYHERFDWKADFLLLRWFGKTLVLRRYNTRARLKVIPSTEGDRR